MNTKVRIRLLAAIFCTLSAQTLGAGVAREALGIIPQPASIERREGSFVITPSTQVVAEGDAAAEAAKFAGSLRPPTGYPFEITTRATSQTGAIQMKLDPSSQDRLGEEGYELDVKPASIAIVAYKPAGLFHAAQTLLQLLPPAIFSRQEVKGIEWRVPCVRVVDRPRFGWRGLLIDPARHFLPVTDVERFIDVMALHKFNRLQIHFTDDVGWRIEIKKYPQLVDIGAWMDFTTIHGGTPSDKRPGGFYTQADIRRLVRYAAQRHITIVPEIEMPAHTGAAIVSYPDLGLYPEKLKGLPVDRRWRAHEGVLAPRPQTVAFMQDVLKEVADLFPSRHLHIGGDEANIDHWKKSEEMQAMIQRMGLKGEAGLHSWFVGQMDTFLTSQDRQLVGWDEILQGGLAPGAVVMSWRGTAGGITAAQAGHDVIMAPTSHTYFDYYQGPAQNEPKAIGGFIPLEKAYEFEPIPAELTAEQARHILGGQGQLWGEFIPHLKHCEYMAHPRAEALAEVLWSPREGRSYEQFRARLTGHLERLATMGVNYRPLDRQ